MGTVKDSQPNPKLPGSCSSSGATMATAASNASMGGGLHPMEAHQEKGTFDPAPPPGKGPGPAKDLLKPAPAI